jgi:hypothetical protein
MSRGWSHAMLMTATVLALTGSAGTVRAQTRADVGGGFGLLTQSSAGDSRTSATGIGTTSDRSLVVGVQVSRRVAIEVEPSWSGSAQQQAYSYSPSPSTPVNVASSQRTTLVTFGVRTRVGALEPVVGLSYVGRTITRHATFADGGLYSSDEQSRSGMALAGGVDLGLKIASGCPLLPCYGETLRSTGDVAV